MKPLNRDTLLNYTSQLGLMLLSEAGVELKGRSIPKFTSTEVPFNEKRALLAELNKTLLVLNKINPEKETSGLDAMRSLLNGDDGTDGDGKIKHTTRRTNGSPASVIFDGPGEPDADPPSFQ